MRHRSYVLLEMNLDFSSLVTLLIVYSAPFFVNHSTPNHAVRCSAISTSGTSYLTIADFMVEYEENYLMWETLSPGLLQSEHLSQVRQQVVRFHSFIW